jgi:hypothetical protein
MLIKETSIGTAAPMGVAFIQINSVIIPIQRAVPISPMRKPIRGAQNIGRQIINCPNPTISTAHKAAINARKMTFSTTIISVLFKIYNRFKIKLF